MCTQNIRDWRKSTSAEKQVVVAGGPIPLVSNSPYRVTLVLASTGPLSVWVSTDPNMAEGNGFQLSGDSPRIELWIERHGDLVRKQWFAFSAVGALSLNVFEVFLEGSYGYEKPA